MKNMKAPLKSSFKTYRLKPGWWRLTPDKNGIALVTAMLILLALTSMGVLMITRMRMDARISGADKDNTQALFLAEAGVAKVREWFRYPGRFNPSSNDITGGITMPAAANATTPNTFVDCSQLTMAQQDQYSSMTGSPCIMSQQLNANTAQDFFAKRLLIQNTLQWINNSTGWSQFVDVDQSGTQDAYDPADTSSNKPSLEITNQAYLKTLFGKGSNMDLSSIGVINSIEIYPPIGSGQSVGPNGTTQPPRPICTVRVTATTVDGATKTIEQELYEARSPSLSGAAQSGYGTASWGNTSIHWGPVKVIGDSVFTSSNTPQCGTSWSSSTDPWYTASVSGTATFQGQGSCGSGGLPCNPCPASGDPCGCAGLANSTSARPFESYAIYQGVSVSIDHWDLDYFKNYALSGGTYYQFTDASDVCQGDGNGNCVGGTYQTLSSLLINQSSTQHPFLFIDDPNHTVPNGTTISLPASFMEEDTVFNVDPSDIITIPNGANTNQNVQDPGGNPQTISITYDGILYTTGQYQSTGNAAIFGALLAENGITAGGTPDVYYDATLRNGRLTQANTAKGKWREIE